MNSVISRKNWQFYAASSTLHVIGFSSLSFFFRFRRVGLVPTLLIGSGYFYFFQKSNNILYKVIVDRNVIGLARSLGQGHHVQPVGHFKNRGVNYI